MSEPQDLGARTDRAAEVAAGVSDGGPALHAVPEVPGTGPRLLASMSEVELVLALAATGDLIDAKVTVWEDGDDVADMADWLADACADFADIEDELMRRGFSHNIFCV